MPKQEDDSKKPESAIIADALVPLVGALLQADPQAKVRVHDSNWVDVALSTGASAEAVIRAVRAMTEQLKEPASRPARRKELLADKEDAFVARLPKEVEAGASFCLLEGPKLYIDAIPMALKVFLCDFAAEAGSVSAATATMTRGLCAELRAAPDYVPNR